MAEAGRSPRTAASGSALHSAAEYFHNAEKWNTINTEKMQPNTAAKQGAKVLPDDIIHLPKGFL